MNEEDIIEKMDKIVMSYHGNFGEISSAIGTYIVARHYGWKVLFLAQDQKTIKKHEKVLGFKFRDVLPEEGELADRAPAWRLVKKMGQFWKTVKGEIKGIRSPEIGDQAK